MKVLFDSFFLKLLFGFGIFWQKNIVKKAACKMLMKWTTGINDYHPMKKNIYF